MTDRTTPSPLGLQVVLIPILSVGILCMVSGETPARLFQVGGLGSWLVLVASLPAVAAVMLGARHDDPLRGTLLASTGALAPIVFGFAGHAWGMTRVLDALRNVGPGEAGPIAVQGFAESLRPIELGFAIGGGFLASGALPVLTARRSGAIRFGFAGGALAAFGLAHLGLSYSHTVESFASSALESRFEPFSSLASRTAELHLLVLVVAGAVALTTGVVAVVRSSGGGVDLGGLVVGALAIVAFGGNEVVVRATSRSLAGYAHPSFSAHLDAFAALSLHGAPSTLPDVVVIPDAVIERGGRRVALGSSEIESVFREALSRADAGPRRIAVAIDARLSPANLARVIRAVRSIGADELELRGIAEHPGGIASIRALGIDPFASLLVPQIAAARIRLTPPSRAAQVLDRRTITNAPAPHPGVGANPNRSAPRFAVELRLGDDATPTALATHAEAISSDGDLPLLVETFSNPTPPPTPAPPPTETAPPPTEIEPALANELDAASVRRVFQPLTPAIRECYQRELVRNPQLSGRATVEVTFGGGRPASIRVDAGTLGARMQRCIERALLDATFPDPGSPVTVRYPFAFEAPP